MLTIVSAGPAISSGGAAVPARVSPWRRARAYFAILRRATRRGRPRRVILLTLLLALVSAFDLVFTLLAARIGHFVELNPVAAGLVQAPGALVAFKVLLMGLAFAIFLRLRTHPLTELACWCLCGLYAALAGRWWVYYFRCHA